MDAGSMVGIVLIVVFVALPIVWFIAGRCPRCSKRNSFRQHPIYPNAWVCENCQYFKVNE